MSFVLKKRFGQNFLIDNNILEKISSLIHTDKLNILEIGPGDGRLTDKIILKKPNLLTLIEIDNDLVTKLSNKYSGKKNIKLINADILKIDIENEFDIIISNLPYNISSQILVKICLLKNIPNILILMFQKEFAQRLIDEKINSINSLVNCFYKIKFNFNVSKNSYRPIPKVDSAVLTFKKIDRKLIEIEEINEFIIFKRKLFSHKRKSLKNILKEFNLGDKFDLNLRVENLKLEQLIDLFRATKI